MGSDEEPAPGLGPLALLGSLVLICSVCSALALLVDRSMRDSEGKHYFVLNQAGVVYYTTPTVVTSVPLRPSDVKNLPVEEIAVLWPTNQGLLRDPAMVGAVTSQCRDLLATIPGTWEPGELSADLKFVLGFRVEGGLYYTAELSGTRHSAMGSVGGRMILEDGVFTDLPPAFAHRLATALGRQEVSALSLLREFSNAPR